jgi:GNAT superfamily N-acetyltransferase
MINAVDVDPDYRRLGVATTLLRAAEQQLGRVVEHSTDLSDDALAWAMTTSADPAARWYQASARRVQERSPLLVVSETRSTRR